MVSVFWSSNLATMKLYTLFSRMTTSCLVVLLYACQQPQKAEGGWQLVFKNDKDGKSVYGQKSELIDAVRLGYPVRIGWGSTRVEHTTNADFLTIFEGEVFAQTKTIIGQAPRVDNDTVKIRFRTQNHWTKMAGTNGYSTAFMTDYFKDSIVGGGVDRYSATSWYVLFPNRQADGKAQPLWREDSPNWNSWKKNNE